MTSFAAVVWASSRSIVDIDATAAIQVVLFVLCFLLLRGLVFKPLLRLVDERRRQTQGLRDEARQLEVDAEGRLKKLNRAVAATKADTATEREQLRLASKQREHEILQAAKDEAARVAEAARRTVAAKRAEAEHEAEAEARGLATAIAGRLAGRPL
jgi:F-type H+-transporting ATPase subunit b